jgi:hypothetical protein
MRRTGRQWSSLVASQLRTSQPCCNFTLSLQALPGVVNGSALGTTSATNASTASAVLKTAGFTSKQAFTSRVSIEALMELRYADSACAVHSAEFALFAPVALVNRLLKHSSSLDTVPLTAGTSTWRAWVVLSLPSWCMELLVSLRQAAGEGSSVMCCLCLKAQLIQLVV